jgi:FHS family L-fucose permease-like MFS transporter
MADQAEMTTGATGYVDKPMKHQYMLFFGVAAQFSYVGAQVGIAAYFINFFTQARPDLDITQAHQQGANFYAIAQALFAVGRFSAAGLMYIMKPRWVLLIYQTMIMIFLIAAITVNTGNGSNPNWGGLSMLMIVLFFESCIFPTIFTLSLRGLGRHTKRGASFLVASICGGAVMYVFSGTSSMFCCKVVVRRLYGCLIPTKHIPWLLISFLLTRTSLILYQSRYSR